MLIMLVLLVYVLLLAPVGYALLRTAARADRALIKAQALDPSR